MTANDPERLILVLRMAVKMRSLQKDYFKTRSQEALIASKKAEREFDIAVGALKL